MKLQSRETNRIQLRHSSRTRSTSSSSSSSTSNNAIEATKSIIPQNEASSPVEIASIEKFLDNIMKEKPIRFTPQQLTEFTNNYSIQLGSGGFGIAYRGSFPNGVPIAVKVLHKALNKRAEEQFMAEVATIGRTYHIHLVRLYGFCFDPTVKALVYEFMENGSLDYYLFSDNLRIEWATLYEIAIGTAKGIRYLHEECEQRIIHYDIKPGNVLLDKNFSPKVADFGLAKLCNRDVTHVTNTGGRGTPGYAAPEMWMPLPVTHKCDVYSFGMLLFEILGRRRNLNLGGNESQEWFPRWVWDKYENGELGSLALVCRIEQEGREKAERMSKLGLWCVQYKPEGRPSMGKVVRMLEGEEEIMAPPNPFEYMDLYAKELASSTGTMTTTSTISRGSTTSTKSIQV
ncbi:G-type lectin S-receptor-like serine/threonine-protein kinase [Apostasia shenzhenica]|uniref:G-type lectin S-receptor-like serine/threonine-protein kinase n=1 Tax=Apostasia shenzhenica TaxID=1088818 RepID=A0A2I0A778_9ASPA|nr:G-type lectin S-receptor-like serine/threonine-protein kinase [Apostasia shenzhenica]